MCMGLGVHNLDTKGVLAAASDEVVNTAGGLKRRAMKMLPGQVEGRGD